MLDVIVDRTKWYRGQGYDESKLLRSEGQMCCVGFACLAAGLTPSQIENWATVQVAHTIKAPRLAKMVCLLVPSGKPSDVATGDAAQLYTTNDKPGIDNATRERDIRDYGLKVGLAFSFVN